MYFSPNYPDHSRFSIKIICFNHSQHFERLCINYYLIVSIHKKAFHTTNQRQTRSVFAGLNTVFNPWL